MKKTWRTAIPSYRILFSSKPRVYSPTNQPTNQPLDYMICTHIPWTITGERKQSSGKSTILEPGY